MKRILLITVILLMTSFVAQAQHRDAFNPRKSTKINSPYSEDFKVSLKKTVSGIEFQRQDPLLDDNLKNKIRHFFSQTEDRDYQSTGQYDLHIVKKDGKYYVLKEEGFFDTLLKM